MKKVLLPQKIHEDGLNVLKGQAEIIVAPDATQDTVSRYIQEVDGVILRTTSIDESALDVRYAPYLSGDRYSMVQRRGAFTGLNLKTTRKKILRSMVDGNTQQMYALMARLGDNITLQNKISLTGGGASGAINEYKTRTWFKGYQLEEKKTAP